MTGITQKLVALKSILHEYDMALCDADCNMDEIESRAHKLLDMECLRDLLEYIEQLNGVSL